MKFEFHIPPAVGSTLSLDAQRYDLVAVEDYVRADGLPSKVLVWRSACPDCGASFEVKTGLKGKDLTRRCADHRAPMRRVSGTRKPVEVIIDLSGGHG